MVTVPVLALAVVYAQVSVAMCVN